MNYTSGKSLLTILKPKTGPVPTFGEIPFDQIIFNSLKSSPDISSSSEPKVLILCGPPGCGKSTVKLQLLSQARITNYINIDPDEIRSILMRQGVTFPDDKTMAGITNAFNKRISDEAQRNQFNILFDTTGQNFRAVSDLIYTSRILGYKSIFTIIWASLDTCLRRVNYRNQKLRESGAERIELPPSIAEGIYNGFTQAKGTASMFLLDYPVRADEVYLYDNNVDGREPVLLYKKNGSNVEYSTNFPTFYNMKLNEKEPYIQKITKGGKRRTRKSTFKRRKGRANPSGKKSKYTKRR
jgi:predicted kinase